MHTVTTTPAESLLQLLLCSEKLEHAYQFSIEKEESSTSISIKIIRPEKDYYGFRLKE